MFKEFYYNLGLSSGDLLSLWSFDDSRADSLIECYNNQYSGFFSGQTPASFYATSGKASFDGSSYSEISGYSSISNSTFSCFLDFERERSDSEILFSSYSKSGPSLSSGVTFGLTDSNKVFFQSEYSGTSYFHVFQNVSLAKRNILNFNVASNYAEVQYLDIISEKVQKERYLFETQLPVQSNRFRVGGNPAFESEYNIPSYSGGLSFFSLSSQVFDENMSKEISKGFKTYQTVASTVYDIESKQEVFYHPELTQNISSGFLVNLNTGLSNYISNLPSNQKRITGSISASADSSGVISFSAPLYDATETLLGTYSLGGITSPFSGDSFPISFYYNNNGLENILLTYKSAIPENSSIQSSAFSLDYNVNEVWKNNTTLPSNEDSSAYETLKFSGAFYKDVSENSFTIKSLNNSVPSDTNKSLGYSNLEKRFFVKESPAPSSSEMSLYYNGLSVPSTGFSVKPNKNILISGETEYLRSDYAVYDKSGSLSTLHSQADSSLAINSSSGFFKNSSICFESGVNRLTLNTHYLETHNYDLLYGKSYYETGNSAINTVIMDNETGNWNLTNPPIFQVMAIGGSGDILLIDSGNINLIA